MASEKTAAITSEDHQQQDKPRPRHPIELIPPPCAQELHLRPPPAMAPEITVDRNSICCVVFVFAFFLIKEPAIRSSQVRVVR